MLRNDDIANDQVVPSDAWDELARSQSQLAAFDGITSSISRKGSASTSLIQTFTWLSFGIQPPTGDQFRQRKYKLPAKT